MNEENRQKLSQLAERAWANETLKNELLTEPTLAIQKDGIEIPEGFDVEVLSDKESISFNLVPRKLENPGELSDGALANVTGGTSNSKSGSNGSSKGQTFLVFTFKSVA